MSTTTTSNTVIPGAALITESKPLLDTQLAASAAVAGAGLVNASAARIQKARLEGPLTFRMMGFLGGLCMMISNGLAIVDRFFSFHFAGALIAIYCVGFGLLITLMEGVGPCSQKLHQGISYYCHFLDLTWGRGALYFFCGSLQASNWNLLDWAIGGYMMFTGVLAMGVGINAARNLRLLHFAVGDETKLQEQWRAHDVDGNNFLDVKELTAFIRDTGVDMSRNEVAAVFLALDKNFDERISYEEFYAWWMAAGTPGGSRSITI